MCMFVFISTVITWTCIQIIEVYKTIIIAVILSRIRVGPNKYYLVVIFF